MPARTLCPSLSESRSSSCWTGTTDRWTAWPFMRVGSSGSRPDPTGPRVSHGGSSCMRSPLSRRLGCVQRPGSSRHLQPPLRPMATPGSRRGMPDPPTARRRRRAGFSPAPARGRQFGLDDLRALLDSARMSQEQAQVLSRGGNWAVVQLAGRAFPGLHVQGDTFAALWTQLAEAARMLREDPGDGKALDDLDDAVREAEEFLRFYEAALAERGIQRPY
ncbi:DUF6959 family protein [Micromonospora tulbaghiae]